jgi:hypothetical protein
MNKLNKGAHHRFVILMLLSIACAVMLAIFNQVPGAL